MKKQKLSKGQQGDQFNGNSGGVEVETDDSMMTPSAVQSCLRRVIISIKVITWKAIIPFILRLYLG